MAGVQISSPKRVLPEIHACLLKTLIGLGSERSSSHVLHLCAGGREAGETTHQGEGQRLRAQASRLGTWPPAASQPATRVFRAGRKRGARASCVLGPNWVCDGLLSSLEAKTFCQEVQLQYEHSEVLVGAWTRPWLGPQRWDGIGEVKTQETLTMLWYWHQCM